MPTPLSAPHAAGDIAGATAPLPRRALAVHAFTLASFFAASSAPTPLYRLYQEAWGFSAGMLTLVFAVYAFSLLAALLTTGSLSEHLGRRPVIVGALVVQIGAMVAFARAGGVADLLGARLLQGFATGMAAAVLGAALLDVNRERGTLVNALSPVLGMALGALLTSELVQYAPAPLHTVFYLLMLLFGCAIALALGLPETVAQPAPGLWASFRPRVRVPPHARDALLRMLPINTAVWALGAFYLSLGPSMVRATTGSAAAGGWVIFLMTTSAAVSMWVMRARPSLRLLRLGGMALVAGSGITLAGVYAESLWLLVAAAMVAGTGFGMGFQGGLRSVMVLAQAQERAGLLAAVYVLSYMAFSLPAIAAGLAVQQVGLLAVTYGYGSVLIVLALAALWANRGLADD